MKILINLFFFSILLAANNVYNKQLNELFKFSSTIFTSSQTISPLVFNVKCKIQDNNISNKLVLERYKLFTNNLGIFTTGGGFIDNSFKTNVNIGIKWKLLNNGYRFNKKKASVILLENQLKKLNKKSINFDAKYNMIIYYFNKAKINLLEKYIQFLRLKFEIYRYRYWMHTTSLDQLLILKNSIQEKEDLVKTYKLFNSKMICKTEFKGEIEDYTLDYNAILSSIDVNKTLKSRINNQILDLKYDKYDKWNLNVYANKNFQTGQTKVGVDFSIPLYNNKIEKVKELEKLKFISDENNQKLKLFLYLQKNYYIFRYDLNSIISFRNKLVYLKYILNKYKIRYKLQIGNNNINKILETLDKIFDIKFKIIEIKQKITLETYNMLYHLNLDLKPKFIKSLDIKNNLKLRKGIRSLYIWANGFKKYDNNILINFLKTKNIREVIISVSENQDFQKLSKFLKLAKENDIKIQFLVFDNSWLFHLDYIDKKINSLNIYNNYNLNIFLPEEVVKKYHTRFIDILKYISVKYPKYKVNVTIPYLENNLLKEVKLFSNKIYSFDKRYLGFNINFIVDCSKYSNELELEIYIDNIVKYNKYISLYDLKTYIKGLK